MTEFASSALALPHLADNPEVVGRLRLHCDYQLRLAGAKGTITAHPPFFVEEYRDIASLVTFPAHYVFTSSAEV